MQILISLNNNLEDNLDYYLYSIPNTIKDKILKYKNEDCKKNSIISFYIKKKLCDNNEIYFSKNGKPLCNNTFFNISHDFKCVVGVKNKNPIGIDIVYKYRTIYIDYLKNSFTNNELNFINNDKFNLLKLWSIKESFLKMKGYGLTINMKRININFVNNNNIILYFDNILCNNIFIKFIELEKYFLTICVENYEIKNYKFINFNIE